MAMTLEGPSLTGGTNHGEDEIADELQVIVDVAKGLRRFAAFWHHGTDSVWLNCYTKCTDAGVDQ